MSASSFAIYALPVLAAAVAGAVNSVAGGGTLLTFPALQAAGLSSLAANATSTVALWPGQLSSLFGLRAELGHSRGYALPIFVIGLVGGVLGAYLLTVTDPKLFDKIVPFLILLATTLLVVQEPLARRRAAAIIDSGTESDTSASIRLGVGAAIFLFGVAVYGGYFGAGIGILTLAALGAIGMRDIHQMNGVKAIYTLGVNGVAALIFVARHRVDWKMAALMAVGAIAGGYFGAGVARKIGAKNVRRTVIGIGFALAAFQLYRSVTGH